MTLDDAADFVRAHGIVMESAHGPLPSVADRIAGEPVRGSWWRHPASRDIFRITRALRDSDSILVCRLIAGKITFVHSRLWPALARLGDEFPGASLARLHEQHSASGKHVVSEQPFPTWVPADVMNLASALSVDEAWAILRASAPGVF